MAVNNDLQPVLDTIAGLATKWQAAADAKVAAAVKAAQDDAAAKLDAAVKDAVAAALAEAATDHADDIKALTDQLAAAGPPADPAT